MTTSELHPPPSRRSGLAGHRRDRVAERVELLLAEMTLEEKVGQLGSRWVGNGHRRTPRPEPRRGRTTTTDVHVVAPMQDVFAAIGLPPLEEASRHGLGHLTRVYGSAPVTASRRRGRAGPAAADRDRVVPARHPGPGARGVPDRLHRVRGDGLSGRDRLGRDLRPGSGRADGRGHRPGHGRARRPPGAVPGAGRRAGLPLGAGRGDDRRGPVPGRDARRGVRPRPAERRRPRHAEALRRILRLPRRAATTARCRWAGASCWTSSCRRSRPR